MKPPNDVIQLFPHGLHFQNSSLNEIAIFKYYSEFPHSLVDFCGLIGTDASKSSNLTAIAGCSLKGHFGYLIYQANSIFTNETLAIVTAIDKLVCPSRIFIIFTDSRSVLSAFWAVSTASQSVILWLHAKLQCAAPYTPTLIISWVPEKSWLPFEW